MGLSDNVNNLSNSYSSGESVIVVVSIAKGYLLSSIVDQFKNADYNVRVVDTISSFEKVDGAIIGVFTFMEETLLNDQQFLVYIRDRATEDGFPIFISGNEQEIIEAKSFLPEHLITASYLRPINVKDMVSDIGKYLEEHDKSEQKVILAVDDSGVMLNSIKNWLSDKYQVMLADSGVAAIKYITLKRPDLIILDYEMPIIDGKQTLAMIRSEKDFSDIPVIFLTGRQDKDSIMEVMEYRPAGYLLKTMKPYDVHKYIDDFFQKREVQEKADSLKKLIKH